MGRCDFVEFGGNEIMSWEKTALSNVSVSIQTGPFGSQLHQSDYSEIGIPVVMPKDLLAKIKEKITELDRWTDKQETKAEVDNLSRDTLWEKLPECYDEVSISTYRQKIYEYVYTRYREVA